MKTLHLVIISGISIAVLATLVAVLAFNDSQPATQAGIEDIGCGNYPAFAKNFTSKDFGIEGLNDTYKAGCPVTVSFHFATHEPNCQFPQILVTNLSTGNPVYGPSLLFNYTNAQCSNTTQQSFYAGLERNQLITKPQKYKIIATLYDKQYQQVFNVIPSEYSGKNITAETALLPGSGPYLSCPAITGTPSENILGASGFDGIYERYLDMAGPRYKVEDYFLKPGHSGSITIRIHSGSAFPTGQNLATGELILNKDSSYGNFDHYGVTTSYSPGIAVAGLDGTATFSLVISTTQDAAHGTYWMYLPPGGCVGGKLVLLTVGDRPMSQPPDLIGYDPPADFSFSESPLLTAVVRNFGIHTFGNCSLTFTDNKTTTIINTFDEIPPGYVYKYHFASNPDKGDKVALECKNPEITKAYSPSRWP